MSIVFDRGSTYTRLSEPELPAFARSGAGAGRTTRIPSAPERDASPAPSPERDTDDNDASAEHAAGASPSRTPASSSTSLAERMTALDRLMAEPDLTGRTPRSAAGHPVASPASAPSSRSSLLDLPPAPITNRAPAPAPAGRMIDLHERMSLIEPPRWPGESSTAQPDPVARSAPAEPSAKAPAAPASGSIAATPTASPTDLQMMELVLADPMNHAIATQLGGTARPLPASTETSRSLISYYGEDLAGRMNQLARGLNTVRDRYLDALQYAANHRGEGVPGCTLVSRPAQFDDSGDASYWGFSETAFTREYARGSTLEQRAFRQLYGDDALKVEVDSGEFYENTTFTLSDGSVLKPGGHGTEIQDGQEVEVNRLQLVSPDVNRVNPLAPPDMIDKTQVWFDPTRGFVTSKANIHRDLSFVDRAAPIVIGIAAAWAVGPGALALTTTAGAAVGGGIAGAAVGAGVAAAASSIATQLVATGDLNFKQVLTSTLTGAVTGGVMRAAGWTAGQLDDVQADLPTRAAAIAGRATFQGGLQELTGGHFKDGFTTGLTSGIADELSARLDSAIAQNQSLSSAERGAYTLLRTAASSAVRAAANPNDALSGMATDFLGALVGDGLNSASAEYKGGQPGDSSGTGSFGTMPPSEAHFEGADDALGAPPETQHTTTAEPPAPTPEESQAAFRQSERGYRTSTDETVAHPIEPAADDAALPTQVIEVVGRHMTPGEELAYDTEQWIRQRAALADGFWLTQQDAAVDDSSPTSFVGSHISRLLAQAGADTAVGSLRLLTDPETQIATIRGAGDALTHPVQTAERIWNGVEALMAMPADERGDAVFKAAVAVALPAGAPRSLVWRD